MPVGCPGGRECAGPAGAPVPVKFCVAGLDIMVGGGGGQGQPPRLWLLELNRNPAAPPMASCLPRAADAQRRGGGGTGEEEFSTHLVAAGAALAALVLSDPEERRGTSSKMGCAGFSRLVVVD